MKRSTTRTVVFTAAMALLGAVAPRPALAQSALPDAAVVPTTVFGKITPSFSIAPRSVFRRRGPRGARMDSRDMSFYLSANLHELLPAAAAKYWPSPVRLSVGHRGFSGSTGETIVGLDLDAAQLPGNHPAWVRTKQLLHAIRLPGPALIIGPGGTRGMGLTW